MSTGRSRRFPPLRVQYADFTMWQREQIDGHRWDADLAHWAEHLEGVLSASELMIGPACATADVRVPYEATALLAPDLTSDIRAFSRRERVTTFMTMLAAFAVLISRHTGELDLVVGTPVAGRHGVALERLIGLFVNSVAIRVWLGEDPTFRALVAQLRRSVLAAWVHQELPFEQVVQRLCPERGASRSPLFQVIFALQNHPLGPFMLHGMRTLFFPCPSSHRTSRCAVK